MSCVERLWLVMGFGGEWWVDIDGEYSEVSEEWEGYMGSCGNVR